MKAIAAKELLQCQAAILVAIALQISIADDLHLGPKYLVIALELLLVAVISFTAPLRHHRRASAFHKTVSILLIGIISIANAGQLILIINALVSSSGVQGKSLLSAAIAIFITNIIMFGLWYWELDSPGLSGSQRKNPTDHFLFSQTQANQKQWGPAFFDYLYLSITNSTAFSPTDTLPLTHAAKALMSAQSIVALLTIVLVTARAVNILG